MKNSKLPANISKEVMQMIDVAINKAVEKAFNIGKQSTQQDIKNYYQHLENRLTALPHLILNIEKYDLDIADLLIEGQTPRKSKDICGMPSQGIRLTDEEKFEARLLTVQRKKIIDQEEIDEIKAALKIIEDDEYYKIIEYRYFQNMSDDKIAESMFCDLTTIWRNRGRLLRIMMIRLYGANVLKAFAKSNHKLSRKYVKK